MNTPPTLIPTSIAFFNFKVCLTKIYLGVFLPMSSHTRVSALFSNRNFVADWCNCSERYSYIISILHQSCPLFPSLSSHRRNCSAFPDGFIVSQITKEILNNGIFFPFQPDNANMLLLSIVFCRIQALFLSVGSHS